MKDSRVSTILFNEWICLTSEYEKTLTRIGKGVYQAFLKGSITDEPTLELCRRITSLFDEARRRREEMEQDFRSSAMRQRSHEAEPQPEAEAATEAGGEPESAEQADPAPATDQASAVKSKVAALGKKATFSLQGLVARFFISRELSAFKGQVQEYSRELGKRALVCVDARPVVQTEAHVRLCNLASRLDKDADAKWQEIVESHDQRKRRGGQSFHLAITSFTLSFANFAKNTGLKPFMEKLLKYDYAQEARKLKSIYAGSKHAEALESVQQEPSVEEAADADDQLDILERAFAAQPTSIQKLDGTTVQEVAPPRAAYQPPRPKSSAWPPPPPTKPTADEGAGVSRPPAWPPPPPAKPAADEGAGTPPPPVWPPAPPARPTADEGAGAPQPPVWPPPPPTKPAADEDAGVSQPPGERRALTPPPPLTPSSLDAPAPSGRRARPPLGERRLNVPGKDEHSLPPPRRHNSDSQGPELELELPTRSDPEPGSGQHP